MPDLLRLVSALQEQMNATLAAAIALYFIAFSFCLIKDRDALRSETYSLHKIAIEHGLTGDSITGVITVGAEDRRLLTQHKRENQP